VTRTLLDLAGTIDAQRLERAFEEADRLGLLKLRALEHLCEDLPGRRGMAAIRRLIATAREPAMVRSPLEERFAELCRKHQLPPPLLNVSVLGFQVDALWPRQRLIVELDGFAFHRHRAVFERDRARDTALQVAGYRVVRVTHRRLEEAGEAVAEQLRRLLGANRPEGLGGNGSKGAQ
jgi:very-short-patch-repair endonuclease